MQQEIYKTIKEFSGQANLIVTPRIFIDYLNGDIFTALLLNQLIYWTDRTKNSWIYKTYSEWEKEIGINEYHIRKSSNILKNMELLKTKIKKVNGNPTVHYQLNIDNFSVSFLQFLKKRNFKISRNDTVKIKETYITENTTKITPKTTNKYIPSEFIKFSKEFLEKQKKNHPNLIKEITLKTINNSASEIEKLIKIDKFNFEKDIMPVIGWAINDNFWTINLLSLVSIRKKGKNGRTKFENIYASYEQGKQLTKKFEFEQEIPNYE